MDWAAVRAASSIRSMSETPSRLRSADSRTRSRCSCRARNGRLKVRLSAFHSKGRAQSSARLVTKKLMNGVPPSSVVTRARRESASPSSPEAPMRARA